MVTEPAGDKEKGDSVIEREFQYDLGGKNDGAKDSQSIKDNKFHFPKWYVSRNCDSRIRDWLDRNHSGVLLVSGYRGVGKSSCVDRILCEMEGCRGASAPCIDSSPCNKDIQTAPQIDLVRVNMTSVLELQDLAFLFCQKICENLGFEVVYSASGRIERIKPGAHRNGRSTAELPRDLEERIVSLLNRISSTTELSSNVGGSSGLNLYALDASVKASKTITNRLHNITESEIVLELKNILQSYSGKAGKRIVFVFDEIDKLKGFSTGDSTDSQSIRNFEELVGKLKIVLSQSQVTFIFVAGRESYYRWQMDVSRRKSVYSSVFDYVVEVEPFLAGKNVPQRPPGDIESELKKFVANYLSVKFTPEGSKKDKYYATLLDSTNNLGSFVRYLLWKGRGIPRNIIHELEKFIKKEEKGYCLKFTPIEMRRIKFYSGLVKELYNIIVARERLDNDAIFNLIILAETLFKFYRFGFNYADLRLISVSVDQEIIVRNEYYYDLAIELLRDWWIENNYGRKSRYVFQPNIKASIDLLSNIFQEEAVAFKFDEEDFKSAYAYFRTIDERIDGQAPDERIFSIRIQVLLGRIQTLIGNDFQAIEFYKKAIRLGNSEIARLAGSMVGVGNSRLLTRIMADSYLEIGNIMERKQRLREAMSFYQSGFLVAQKGYEKLSDAGEYKIKLVESLEGDGVSERARLIGSHYAVGEEAVDALSYMAFVHWKWGKLDDAEAMLEESLETAKKKLNPYKTESQRLLLGYFRFRISKAEEAIEEITKVQTNSLLPQHLLSTAKEAMAYSYLSLGKYKEAIKEIDDVFSMLDFKMDQRRIIEIKTFKLRIVQLELRGESKITDPKHTQLVKNLFRVLVNRHDDESLSDENPISVRQYYHLCGMLAWHIFAIIVEKSNNIEKEGGSDVSKEAWKFISECRPIFGSFSEKCLNYIEKHSITPLVHGVTKEEVQELLGKVRDGGSLEEFKNDKLLLFLEQLFLSCARFQTKHIFTHSASEPFERVAFLYLWNSKRGIGFGTKERLLNTAQEYFQHSLKEQADYHKYQPYKFYGPFVANLNLGDIWFAKLNKGGEQDLSSAEARTCIKYYSDALSAIAGDLKSNYSENPLHPNQYLKESNLLPRLEMYEVADSRNRLNKLFDKNKDVESVKEAYLKVGITINQDSNLAGVIKELPGVLKRFAITCRQPVSNGTKPAIDQLRDLLALWRYFPDSTTTQRTG